MTTTIFDSAIYRPTGGFMGLANSYDLTSAKLAVLGMPFDCGVHPTRVGSRLGPAAIREQSGLIRPYQPPIADFNPLTELAAIDCGDAACSPGQIGPSFEVMEEATWRIASAGARTLTMGGDGSVTLPQLRALRRIYPDLALLHIDAHTDTYPVTGQERHTTATTFTCATEEGLIAPDATLHIGARGPTFMGGVFEFTRGLGHELIPDRDLRGQGFDAVIAHVHERFKNRQIYLCFDMDVFDPSCAPGVATPTWGGLTAAEGLGFLQALAGLDFVAFDVNTVSPPHDQGGMTAFLAGCVMLECLALACRVPGGPRQSD